MLTDEIKAGERTQHTPVTLEESKARRTYRIHSGKRYTARGLRRMPTLSVGQFSNLKINDGQNRVWLSRMTVEDGMPYNNAIEIERLIDGRWTSVSQYPG